MTVESQHEPGESSAEGIITFNRMEHALRAEKFLKASGLNAQAVVPPHHLDTGCNLAVIFDLSRITEVERVLEYRHAEFTYIGAVSECRYNL